LRAVHGVAVVVVAVAAAVDWAQFVLVLAGVAPAAELSGEVHTLEELEVAVAAVVAVAVELVAAGLVRTILDDSGQLPKAMHAVW